jgi:hypothetical protein
VSQALATTFQILRETDNEAASRVLIPALDGRFSGIRDRALETLLKRRNSLGHLEILRRLHTLDEPWRRTVQANHSRMLPALREAVISSDCQLCINGCNAAVSFRQYDLVPAILIALENPANPNAAVVSEALLGLTAQICEAITAAPEDADRREAQAIRRRVVAALELSVGRFARHRRREIVEAFVLLTYRDNAVLRQVLQDPYHPAFVVLVDMLSKCPNGEVISLLLSYLDHPQPPSAVLSIIAKRSDPQFIMTLLRKIGHEGPPVVVQNLRRIESMPWIHGDAARLDALDDFCQAAAVRLATTVGIPRVQALSLVEYVLLRGKTGARRAAAEAFEQFRGADANLVALQSLDDGDPVVQARILQQLRGRGIPGALARLIEAVDSPHEVVRDTACKCLAEFSFDRYVKSFDLLDDEIRASNGELVRKVDPHASVLLRAELTSAVRTRRLRGLAVARALRLVAETEDAISAMLRDPDHLIRAEAAATLGESGSAAAAQALADALADRDPIVRDAVERSLRRHNQLVTESLLGPSQEHVPG